MKLDYYYHSILLNIWMAAAFILFTTNCSTVAAVLSICIAAYNAVPVLIIAHALDKKREEQEAARKTRP